MVRIDQKIVIVTRPTQLAALRQKFATRTQAKFQIVSAKQRELARVMPAAAPAQVQQLAEAAFLDVDAASQTYDASIQHLKADLEFTDFDLPVQTIDRDFLPNFVFGPNDIVVTVGQDGLVANTAKYALGLPIVAVNPDPQRFDGILLPFRTDQAKAAVRGVLEGKAKYRQVTLAEVHLADGQKLLAFNELFIGNRTHISARYKLNVAGQSEPQSSSGVLVCTGAGSTGWLSSIFNMAAGVRCLLGGAPLTPPTPSPGTPGQGKGGGLQSPDPRSRLNPATPQAMRMEWEDPRLIYVVREPFLSKSSRASLVAGIVPPGHELILESDMAANGVIFSDGVESDYLEFNAGSIARIRTASGKAKLVVP